MQLTLTSALADEVHSHGLVPLPQAFGAEEIAAILSQLTRALQRDTDGAALRAGDGPIYAARNVLQVWPRAGEIWKKPSLREALRAMLGADFGLVRALYFDKPPGHSWTLPWHKDLTIAVRDNNLPSTSFEKPTRKAGVPHVEAPVWLLERMLTARIHLDDVSDENGPLRVVPGSHRAGKDMSGFGTPQTLHARAGDVLLIRPLVAHASGRSHEDTSRHRRILHLEFASDPVLPDGYEWHDFLR